jgi:hypothetical protein
MMLLESSLAQLARGGLVDVDQAWSKTAIPA